MDDRGGNRLEKEKEKLTLKGLFGLEYNECLQSVMFAPTESKHLNDRIYEEENDS